MKVIFMALLASINLYCNHDEIKGVYCPNYDEIEFSYAEELSILDKVDICLNWQKIIFNYLINPAIRQDYILAAFIIYAAEQEQSLETAFLRFSSILKTLNFYHTELLLNSADKIIKEVKFKKIFLSLKKLTNKELKQFINCLELYDEESKNFYWDFLSESEKNNIFYFLQFLLMPHNLEKLAKA